MLLKDKIEIETRKLIALDAIERNPDINAHFNQNSTAQFPLNNVNNRNILSVLHQDNQEQVLPGNLWK